MVIMSSMFPSHALWSFNDDMKAALYPWHVFGIVVACSEVLLAEERHHLILFLIHLHLRDKESSVATGIPQLGHRLADQR
jgi:hypothetical protein